MKNPFDVYTSLRTGKKNKQLEWEESAHDSKSFVEGFFDEERTAPNIYWLWLVLVICFSILTTKLFLLQVINGSAFRSMSEENRIRKQTLLAPRGLIKDRNNQVLAQNTASFNLVATPFDLPKEGLNEEISKLALVFQFDNLEIQTKLATVNKRSFEPVIVKQDLTQAQSILFETKAQEFIGFNILKIPIREYLDAPEFSHMMGYTGVISSTEYARVSNLVYDTNDFIGKTGIESQYESYLHGKNGENQIEVDATGKLLDILGEDNPIPGKTLLLNIDKDLQKKLYEGFKGGAKGAAVAMNPKTGEVLALLSMPGFNNNLFAHGIKKDDYQTLLSDKTLPLFNRAIAGTYPPGSTVKPMVAAAVLQEGVVNERTVITDRGLLVIPNQFDSRVSYNFYGWKRGGLGPMNIRSAIAHSSDIYFYTVAGGHPSSPIKGIGADLLAKYYRKFNVGSLTGIDLSGEKPGLVADPAWKASFFKNNAILSKWYLGDTYHIGIGQGDMLVTPVQVALWTSIIANSGIGFRPHVVQKIIDETGKSIFENKPDAFVKLDVSSQNIKVVQEGMRETVVSGSGSSLNSLSVTSAGKTGTSQFDGADPTRTHAWYTSYAPYENPSIVITVLVEAGGEGHVAAVPIVKEALRWWAENRYNKK